MTKTRQPIAIPPDAPVNNYGVPACPECGKDDFKARTVLGSHRRLKHGIQGMSKAAIEAQRAKGKAAASDKNLPAGQPPTTVTKIVRTKQGKLVCPECGDEFPRLNTLGYHRRIKHGVIGKTNTKEKTEGRTIQCPECGVWCKNNRGLTVHISTIHGIRGPHSKLPPKPTQLVSTAPTNNTNQRKVIHARNGSSPEVLRAPSNEPQLSAEDLLVFQTVGELKGHCRSIAELSGFPTAQFTARVISTLYNQTRR